MRGENSNREAIVETLRRKWDAMQNHLDERGRRMWAASEAEALGRGGVT
ncbi:MAG: ISAzo13 family transposase, partial [Treponema sp.]|nr:ISAzo13 family transposase [Treponema sp.]